MRLPVLPMILTAALLGACAYPEPRGGAPMP